MIFNHFLIDNINIISYFFKIVKFFFGDFNGAGGGT